MYACAKTLKSFIICIYVYYVYIYKSYLRMNYVFSTIERKFFFPAPKPSYKYGDEYLVWYDQKEVDPHEETQTIRRVPGLFCFSEIKESRKITGDFGDTIFLHLHANAVDIGYGKRRNKHLGDYFASIIDSVSLFFGAPCAWVTRLGIFKLWSTSLAAESLIAAGHFLADGRV